MTDSPPTHPPIQSDDSLPIEQQVESVGKLLSSLDDAPQDPATAQSQLENRLVTVRLGIASSLFHALRVRHTPTANHALRVAILCSRWSISTDMADADRDELEVAALLHDIGKIGTPDAILQKPGALDSDERALLAEARLKSLQVLAACASGTNIPKIVAYSSAWFDGSSTEFQLCGSQIPLQSRMIAIADAFDAMTTDRIYRKAMPPEKAIEELCRNAGSQFDPVLVQHFAKVQALYNPTQDGIVARRWITALRPHESNKLWQLGIPDEEYAPQRPEDLFHLGLLDALPDGIMYVNSQALIMRWNPRLATMTGISAESVTQSRWDPYNVKMRWSQSGEAIRCTECPVLETLKTGTAADFKVMIKNGAGTHTPVHLLTVPILDGERSRLGVAVMFRDATEEANLEHRVQTLHKKASLDPLTKIANRAEFDRFHGESITRHTKLGRPCSLIICDIDRFKSINDTHGHQAGDAALVSFAGLLQRHCRDGDLVARYGGEEFVMVCEDFDSDAATKHADDIRLDLASTQLKELNGRCITASFGVTQLQPGDTMETMLRRADRGLLEAKDSGRNCVICLGSSYAAAEDTSTQGLAGWWNSLIAKDPESIEPAAAVADCYLSTNTPFTIVSEKLRGFIADHGATIVNADPQRILLKIKSDSGGRRRGERATIFQMEIDFHESKPDGRSGSLTIIHAILRCNGRRDRRTTQMEGARALVASLKSYLVAQFCNASEIE